MLERILRFSIGGAGSCWSSRSAMAALGAYNYRGCRSTRVPDITNVQVQINTEAPGLLAARGRSSASRSRSRRDGRPAAPRATRARSRVTACRRSPWSSRTAPTSTSPASSSTSGSRKPTSSCRPASSPAMGPIATGLGEIFHVHRRSTSPAPTATGEPYGMTDLRTHPGLDHPAAAAHGARRDRRQHHRRLHEAVST